MASRKPATDTPEATAEEATTENEANKDKAQPASLSMALESDVSGDSDNAKLRVELRNMRAERDNYKRQFDDLAVKHHELELKYEGATASNRR
jgi:hypothetical protein